MYVCMYLCMYVCIYVCMCMCAGGSDMQVCMLLIYTLGGTELYGSCTGWLCSPI